jgi:sialate O-acetylesterase
MAAVVIFPRLNPDAFYMNPFLIRFSLLFLMGLHAILLKAQLQLPEVFSDDMVLQREKPVPVWGRGLPGALVTVRFASQMKTTEVGADSSFSVMLDPMKASAVPNVLTVTSGITQKFSNVLVGDVWICSGQSNMEYPVDLRLKRYKGPGRGEDPGVKELARTDKPDAIRYLYVEKVLNRYPKLPTTGWFTGADSLLRTVTAIGYYFAQKIHSETGVPIGIVSTSWGGTRIEQWTPEWAYTLSPTFSKEVSVLGDIKIDGMKPGQLFTGMILPMAPFAVKGVLWYQGESNAIIQDQRTYTDKFKVFMEAWRKVFQDPNLPFYTVQLAPFLYSERNDVKQATGELLAEFWEAQTNCLVLSGVDMVVTTDLVDDLKDIHPSYKWIIGERMALQALKKSYGQKKLEAHGPMFRSATAKSGMLELQFDYAKGLKSRDGKPLDWFEVAGADGRYVPATATIRGSRILVSSDAVPVPVRARFAWSERARPNLVNGAGLPAFPFRMAEKGSAKR